MVIKKPNKYPTDKNIVSASSEKTIPASNWKKRCCADIQERALRLHQTVLSYPAFSQRFFINNNSQTKLPLSAAILEKFSSIQKASKSFTKTITGTNCFKFWFNFFDYRINEGLKL